MTRASRRRSGRPAGPCPPAATTPVPAADLLSAAGELRDLLGALTVLTGCGHAWGVRVLRRNVELALRSPATLARAENQLDFIEELAVAAWDAADPGFRQAAREVPSAIETRAREAHRRALVERLDGLAGDLCARVESWRRPGARPNSDSPG